MEAPALSETVKDPVDEKPGSEEKPKKLTLKQAKFVDGFVATGNGTEGARFAGYGGNDNQLGVQAFNNLRNPKIARAIADRLHSMADPAMNTVAGAMAATKAKSFLDKDGNIVTTDPEPDHKTRLHAVETWAKMMCKFGVDSHDEVAEDPGIRDEELTSADRLLIRHAAKADAELGEIERNLANDNGGHAPGDQLQQCASTKPGTPRMTNTDGDIAEHDGNDAADHQVEQRSSATSIKGEPAEANCERRAAGNEVSNEKAGEDRTTH